MFGRYFLSLFSSPVPLVTRDHFKSAPIVSVLSPSTMAMKEAAWSKRFHLDRELDATDGDTFKDGSGRSAAKSLCRKITYLGPRTSDSQVERLCYTFYGL